MTMSALIMIVAGIILSFLPAEVGSLMDLKGAPWDNVILQILGAMYFSFGMINWMAKANLIGGIYGRPIAVGNFAHFMMGGLALIKVYYNSHELAMLPLTIIYLVLGVLFGIVLFTHPIQDKTD